MSSYQGQNKNITKLRDNKVTFKAKRTKGWEEGENLILSQGVPVKI